MKLLSSISSAFTCRWPLLAFVFFGAVQLRAQTPDPHSFSRPDEVITTHLSLNAKVDFEARIIAATAQYALRRTSPDAQRLVLDTWKLNVSSVKDQEGKKLAYEWSDFDELFGSALEIELLPATFAVQITYTTDPSAKALQWLLPQQTAGKTMPYLFTQSQAILARTWLPCQDSPGVRFTYDATVAVPKGMMALMSAENPQKKSEDGVYKFRMDQPIPSYLMAMAVGDLEFEAVGNRTGVYAEPRQMKAAVYEFAEMEQMLNAAEALYGPYAWERYDLIVLPPSFPFGGMENPRLTFCTPTIIAGDRSLTALVAHELAHSWSGNLVTNKTWNDFWLNEGFTVYFERRIMEALYGVEYSNMLALLGMQDLQATLGELGHSHADTHLKLALAGRDPDEGLTDVAYEKGYFFLRAIEETVGREKFDAFLRGYFARNAFKVMDTEAFIRELRTKLLRGPHLNFPVDEWVYGPGLPENAPVIHSDKFAAVERALDSFLRGDASPEELLTSTWTTHEWLHFIRQLPSDVSERSLDRLDEAFELTHSGNSEILAAWFVVGLRAGYEEIDRPMEEFLWEVGRRKFLVPIYTELYRVNPDKAKTIYSRSRENYHSVSTLTLDGLLR